MGKHGEVLEIDEKELDMLVKTEFNRLEKEIKVRQPQRDKKGEDPREGIDYEHEVDSPQKGEKLFSEDEEKFINNTVEWLKSRDNKDAIISRIWDTITELESESFYSPDSSDAEVMQDQAESPKPADDKAKPKSEPSQPHK